MTGQELGRGVLRPEAAAGVLEVRRHPPGPGLAAFVETYWNPRWDLRGRADHEQKVLAHPNVHLVFEEPEPLVYGVQRDVFRRVLHGRGQVFGVKFRPGAFRPFAGGPVAALADRAVPAADLFGPEVAEVSARVLSHDGLTEMAALADAFLLVRLGSPDRSGGQGSGQEGEAGGEQGAGDPQMAQVAELVERITASPRLFRVDELAERTGLSVRALQRLFAEYVGASPKWVLRRARLHEVAARADGGAGIDWAALAADLGYADQAHLTRDFTAAVGAPPGRYAAR
ncbi:helix-turn-helix domain-containing protein [Actinacidiphila rubida]|uniref:AraC-type DNA-binding protein n=1 Tax=Actinacidiphila rubida TaxID=310780 RepID=A0A1H8RKS7_9ACTN|nr:helix-turn-helix domain-containing protein [Actinacidiphila rubida]SEO66995.1 AraC-type DNA-binding protein [Actinacidiphila rubida]